MKENIYHGEQLINIFWILFQFLIIKNLSIQFRYLKKIYFLLYSNNLGIFRCFFFKGYFSSLLRDVEQDLDIWTPAEDHVDQ
jgi:hypothetical protein